MEESLTGCCALTSDSMSVERLRLDRASMVAAMSPGLVCRSDLQQEVIMRIYAGTFIKARLAQSVEHGTLNPRVVGSSPTSGAPFSSLNSYFCSFFTWSLFCS